MPRVLVYERLTERSRSWSAARTGARASPRALRVGADGRPLRSAPGRKHAANGTPLRFSAVTSLAAALALPAAVAAIWALLRTRVARLIVATPSADRWHDVPTPLIGGLGIFAGFTAGLGAAVAVGALPLDGQLAGIYAGCSILFLAGLVDDVASLPPLAKLAAQLAATAVVLTTGTSVEIVGNPVFATALGVAWLVGLTNAFNLLDNMDGLAASLAAIASGFFAIAAA